MSVTSVVRQHDLALLERWPVASEHLTVPTRLGSAGTRDRLCRFAPGAQVCFLPPAGHLLPGQAGRIAGFLEPRAADNSGSRTSATGSRVAVEED
jgi:hypothetical protein